MFPVEILPTKELQIPDKKDAPNSWFEREKVQRSAFIFTFLEFRFRLTTSITWANMFDDISAILGQQQQQQ